MNVLAINGSPHLDEGNTAMILSPFLEGMKEAGAIVELFYTRKLKIGPCNGDMSCWFKNPGKCGQDDDMQMLLPKFKEADVIVWASPVYYAGIMGPLKNLMDRQLPLFMQSDAKSKRQKIVLVSTCGAWELSMFDPLLAQMNAGSQLVKEGRISEEIQKKVSNALMPRDAYYKAAQEMMDQVKKSMAQ